MGGIAASGGYYISMAVGDTPDTIFAEPSTWTGSIGVLIPHYDVSGLLEKWNVTDDTIASNPLKLIGSPTRKTSPEIAEKERAILQKLVDESFQDFKDIVKTGRPKFRQGSQSAGRARDRPNLHREASPRRRVGRQVRLSRRCGRPGHRIEQASTRTTCAWCNTSRRRSVS